MLLIVVVRNIDVDDQSPLLQKCNDADYDALDTLHSGNETFGEAEANDYSNSSKIPHYWGESEVENKSEREDHEDIDDQSDEACRDRHSSV